MGSNLASCAICNGQEVATMFFAGNIGSKARPKIRTLARAICGACGNPWVPKKPRLAIVREAESVTFGDGVMPPGLRNGISRRPFMGSDL